MASGSFVGSTDHQYIAVQVSWRTLWQDAAANQSMLRVNLSARRTNVGWTTYGTFTGGLRIDGTNHGWSGSLTLGPGSEWKNFFSADVLITHNSDGHRSVALSAYGGISGAGWASTSASGSANLGKLWRVPPAVSSVVATRTTLTRATITATIGAEWARGTVVTTQLQRRRALAGHDYATIQTHSGKVSSFVDNTPRSDWNYTYRVVVVNPAGSNSATSGILWGGPFAPVNITAEKTSDLDILVSWTPGGIAPAAYDILDNGVVVGSVEGSATSWLHAAPSPTTVHVYTVRAVRDSLSALSEDSATVQILTPPLAPSGLSPDGGMVVEGDVRFAWQHNPVDSTAQRIYQLDYRASGATEWTSLAGVEGGSGLVMSRDITLAAGSWEWRIRTAGAYDGWGPWSAVATVQVITAPVLAITSPPVGDYGSSTLTVQWSWTQAQAVPMAGWRAELRLTDGTPIEAKTGTGAATEATFGARLIDATALVVAVTAWTGDITATAQRSITTAFPAPALPAVTATWDEATGAAQLSVAAGEDGPVETVTIDLERSVDGGATWEPVIVGGPPTFSVADPECLSHGSTLYRAVAWSGLPSGADGDIVELVADSDAMWLSGGAGFSATCRLPYDPDPQVSAGRARTAVAYSGRALPVAYSGAHTPLTWSWSGTFLEPDITPLDPGMTVEDLVRVAQAPEPLHCLRDPDGRRVYGSLSDVQVTRPYPGGRGYSLKLTEATL